jgi:hypothetical protein
VKILDFILCEDIRKEVGNKHTLIGVFDEELNFLVPEGVKDVWPKPIRVGMFIRIKLEENDIKPDRFELTFLYEGKAFGGGHGLIKIVNESKMMNFIFTHNQFPISGEGKISFVLKFYKDNNLINELIPDYEMRVGSVSTQPA